MAGMSSTCNRVAAALFRVEAAMRLDLPILLVQQKPVNGFQIEKMYSQ